MSRRRQRTLRERVRLLFTAAAAVAAVTMAVGAFAFVNLLDSRSKVIDQLDPALVATDEYFAALLAQQNAVRGVLLTDAPEFEEAFVQAREEAALAGEELRELLASREVLLDRFEAITVEAEAWHQEFASAELAATDSGEVVPPEVVQASRAFFDRLRADVGALQREIGAQADDARRDLDDATRTMVLSLAGAVIALLAVATTIVVALRRWVTGPIEQLGNETEQVRLGQLDRPIEAVGPPEIVQLGRDVEAMRARIQADLLEVQAAREALVELTEDLTRSNRDLEQFAYVASHDLQEPLRKVISFSQLLQQRYGDQLDERADQYIEFAVDGARRMQVLINDLLDFSRVGRFSGEMEAVDLDRCVHRATDNLADRIEETGTTVDVVGDLPVVRGELNLLSAVFQNLIGNAIKFRRPDEAPVVRISVAEDDDGWTVSVADNGIGIEPEHADRVFVIFQRLHTKDAYSGTGIGLALCRRIIEHHDGHIWVDTGVASGTTIRFTLPKPPIPTEHLEPATDVVDDGAGVASVGSPPTTNPEGTTP